MRFFAPSLLFLLGFAQNALAQDRGLPTGLDRSESPAAKARDMLEKREACTNGGGYCYTGSCCGNDSCSWNCCGSDLQGSGVGCGIASRCDFIHQTVFIGCCPFSAIYGCTGTPTIITMATTIADDSAPTVDVTTTESTEIVETTTHKTTTRTTTTTRTNSPSFPGSSTIDLDSPFETSSSNSGNGVDTTPLPTVGFPTGTTAAPSETAIDIPSGGGNLPAGGAAGLVKPSLDAGILAMLGAWFFL